jgi:DNA invertase Pin-like site-specific DNA recombinase
MPETKKDRDMKKNGSAKGRLIDRDQWAPCDPAGKSAALYIRVSQEEREKYDKTQLRQSVRDQKRDLIAYAEKQSWSYVVYDKDCELSGTLPMTDRPDMQRMYLTVKAGKHHTVVVRDLKRLCRDEVEFGLLRRDWHSPNGVDLHVLDGSLDIKTRDGQLMAIINTWSSRNEIVYTANQSVKRKNSMAENGQLITTPPYGYRLRIENKKREVYVVESEKVIVKLAYKMCAAGDSLNKIRKAVATAGYTSTRNGKKGTMNNAHVKRWLRNPVYSGRLRYRGLEDSEFRPCPFPFIVSVDQWDEAQRHLDKSSERSLGNRGKVSPHMMVGLLKCGYCHERLESGESKISIYPNMISDTQTSKLAGGVPCRFKNFRCQTKRRHGAVECPDSVSIKEKIIDDFMSQYVGVISSEASMENETADKRREELQTQLNEITKESERVKGKAGRAKKMWVADRITDDDLADITGTVNKQFADLDKKSGRIRDALSGLKPAVTKKVLTGIERWESMTVKERQALLRETVESVLLYKDKLVITTKLNPTMPVTVLLKRGYGNRLEPAPQWWQEKGLKLNLTVDMATGMVKQTTSAIKGKVKRPSKDHRAH